MSGALVLVPTPLERARLDRLGGFGPDATVELVGFGPVAAAARAAALFTTLRPRRVVLVGIAGSFGPRPAPAERFGRVRLDGVGAGAGRAHLLPSALGFPQWQDAAGDVHEELALDLAGGPLLVTAAAAAADDADVAARRARHPGAAGEDMEAFGVALAARLADVPLAVVRGWSNVAGDRDPARWDIAGALAAALALAREVLATRTEGAPREAHR